MNEVFATYLDFEIEIGPGRGREYPVAVTRSPAGEADAIMRFPYDDLALQKRLVVLRNALLVVGEGPQRSLSPEELVVRDFGRDLFDALFSGEVRFCYERSMQQARQENKGLRLKLRVQPSDLAALPWEILYDPRQAEYVCLTRGTPLVRYLDLPQSVPPLSLTPPLRVLGVIAGPEDLEATELAREKEQVERALQGLQARKLVKLTWLKGQTWRHLQKALERGDWHILHLLSQGGHSRGNRLGDKGFMAMAGEEGETRPLSPADLARLLTGNPSLRLALLNARGGDGGASLRDTFISAAGHLVRQGIPAVLAIPYEMTDAAANRLFGAFYEALALGMPVDVAVAVARNAVGLAVDNTVGWGAPVLFMSTPDGLVFNPMGELDTPPAEEPEEPGQAAVPLAAAVQVLEPEPAPAPVAPAKETAEPGGEPAPEAEIVVRSPQPIEPELVLIPAGEFLMGSDPERDPRAYEAEGPQHRVHLPDYHIARTPTTNAQYAAFVEASGYEAPNHWEGRKPPDGKEDQPVAYISWRDAMAYCKWLSQKKGQTYRLPSEAEWEKAARGTDGLIYPWGDEWEAGRCNSSESGRGDATLVDAYLDGASPYGILDMAGNVWEWTASLYRPYPYDPGDGREDLRRVGEKRVLRGGAFYSGARRVRCAYRDSGEVYDGRGNYGFRVVLVGVPHNVKDTSVDRGADYDSTALAP